MSDIANTVSRLHLVLEILNKGIIHCEFIRHLSPLTTGAVLKQLPIKNRAHKFADKFVYIETGISLGGEKQRQSFRQADIAYLTSNASMCFFMKDCTGPAMNPLGRIESDIELLENIQSSDVLILRRVENL
jgi:hypothetical protein